MRQTAVEWLIEQIFKYRLLPEGTNADNVLFHKAKAMQDEQMQLTWNNAIDAVQKDKWHSYDEFYNNNFKSE